MAWLEPLVLRGSLATLEPLSLEHHDGLVAAVEDGKLWKLWYTSVPSPSSMRAKDRAPLGIASFRVHAPFRRARARRR